MELRDYQQDAAIKISETLKKYNICYLQGEVRIGKTLSVLEAARIYGAKDVLFLTKKKAISSIEDDYEALEFNYNITVINYESVHKISGKFDLLILDESHVNGAFPKPSKRTKLIKERYSGLPMIMLSGTPDIESGSQWFHQLWVSNYSPFNQYTNFYKWANDFVDTFMVNYGNGYPTKDYSRAKRDKINNSIKHLKIVISQADAGFTTKIKESILYYTPKKTTKNIENKLLNERVVFGRTDSIVADTPVKLMSKLHQINNGTCIGESGEAIIIDNSKAKFIHDKFKRNKIAIFYYFKAELDIIQQVYGDSVTTDLNEFNSTDKNIALQQSGLEGMNLSKADYIVYYNFGFSGKNFVQSRDRLTVMDRTSNEIFFIFDKGGITEKIYQTVKNKQNYNVKTFKKDYGQTNR